MIIRVMTFLCEGVYVICFLDLIGGQRDKQKKPVNMIGLRGFHGENYNNAVVEIPENN